MIIFDLDLASSQTVSNTNFYGNVTAGVINSGRATIDYNAPPSTGYLLFLPIQLGNTSYVDISSVCKPTVVVSTLL